VVRAKSERGVILALPGRGRQVAEGISSPAQYAEIVPEHEQIDMTVLLGAGAAPALVVPASAERAAAAPLALSEP
jgi:hypothetical protein